MDEVEDVSANPWIYATREVIEQILLYRGRISGHRVDCESDICKKTGEEMLESKAAERHDLLEAYREFRPMILDTDSPEQVFGEEDDVDQILEQLYPGLNFLEICTDRPQYCRWLRCIRVGREWFLICSGMGNCMSENFAEM